MKYFPTIGLEVHAELNTKSKMFCGCKNAPHGSEVNAHVCPVCMAHPGTLPVPNKDAIEMVLRFGQAIGADKADYSEFDRKNYFYPDIPKAYQISQYAYPFLTGGSLAGIELTRVHLEEDTARSGHDQEGVSLVDFNRAGVPLMELVTEPVMHDARTVGDFARELQLILRTLGISEANMERGEMRVEANISISATEGELGVKVEVKNLNSFKAVEAAIDFEINRHTQMLEAGEEITQETRGWDENKNRTFSQRSKETAKDYRYFPDPDIPKIVTSEVPEYAPEILAEKIPVLPSKKRELYLSYGISEQMIETLISDKHLDSLFTQVVDKFDDTQLSLVQLAANYVSVDISALLASGGYQADQLAADSVVELVQLLEAKTIGSKAAKVLLPELFGCNDSVEDLANEKGLIQKSDPAALKQLVAQVVTENQEQVAEYKAGKEAVIKYLVGQGMKLSKGSANPAVLEELLVAEITS